ncbi:restriction endonuclease subunit S [Psychrobacter sp. DD43]|uniref:restriction endonuclease subunit S n=1 Tax=Psychrobacter sp. DD43 TaxID=2774128 RepID=UPI001918B749|nr:restriction endonuclease subunit S [Psychrobacter sp. DD43]
MVPNLLKPSQLGEIPKDWKRVKLSDVMKVRQGLQIAISERLTSPTSTSKEYITIQSIKKTDQVREYVEAPSQRVICSKDDVLMTRTGNTGIVVTGVEGAFHNNFFLMDFDKNRINTTFLVNYLRSPRIQHLILTKAGASTIPDLNHKDFYSIEFPLAPILEQQKIAKILSTWDKAISTTERLIDNSTQQKKALMQQLLTGKKRLLNDEGKPFEGEWEEVKLSEIAQITMGSSPKSDAYNEIGDGLPLLQGNADIKNRKSAPRIYTSQITKECHVDDILFSVRAPVGTVALSNHNACIGRGIAAIKAKKNHSQDYLYQWLLSFELKWERYSQGSTFEAVNSDDIKSLNLSIPNYKEQQKIATVLTNADKEIELLEQQLADLQQEKKALMQVLLTGKKRVVVDGES